MATLDDFRRQAVSVLGRSRAVRGLRDDVRRLRRRVDGTRSDEDPGAAVDRAVSGYLARHRVRGLQIGTGPNHFEGWLSTDLRPQREDVIRMDATRAFPLPDASMDHVYAEHLIEHVSYPAGQRMLGEVRRVLRPGGRVRLATPDLARLVDLYCGRAGADGDHYVRWVSRRYLPRGSPRHPVFVLNNAMRNWGHTFLYDEEVLRLALSSAGFVDVRRHELGESDEPALRGLERHGTAVANERAVRFETMVLEASRPDTPETTKPA